MEEDDLGDLDAFLGEDDDDGEGGAGLDMLDSGMLSDMGSDLDDDDEAKETAITTMTTALLNEKGAPELLPYQSDLVEDLKRQISLQMKEMDRAEAAFAPLYEMEIDRAKYLLASYLRVRLKKLEKFGMHVLLSGHMHDRLSPAELAFTKKYVDIKHEHLTRSMLQHLPEQYRTLIDTYRASEDGTRRISMVREPKLDRVVFCRVTDDVGDFTSDDSPHSAPEEMLKGSSWLARYSSIASLLHAGRAELS